MRLCAGFSSKPLFEGRCLGESHEKASLQLSLPDFLPKYPLTGGTLCSSYRAWPPSPRGLACHSPCQGLFGRAWQGLESHIELLQPSWHIFKGEPCQEPVPVGLSDPWKPSQHAGSSRSQPTLFTKHRLCHQRGNWQKLLFLWMNLLTGSELSQGSLMPALWQSLALTPLSLESHAGAGILQAERSAGSDSCPE